MSVAFFLPGEPDLEALKGLRPDRCPAEFQRGERVWILQTYLHLKAAGRPVELRAEPPDGGIVVFHAKHDKALGLRRLWMRRSILVGVRADNREPLIADAEVLQNRWFADERVRYHIPHWPQPGLIPRDPSRGERIRRAAFKGHSVNVHPALEDPSWEAFLAGRGMVWEYDAGECDRRSRDRRALCWHDYSAVDLIVALRPDSPVFHRSKPASKLVNAWAAGVPAILGPEVAFRDLRRSELDYIECSTVEEARAAVLKLLEEPGLYRAMVENGRARAAEFTRDAVRRRWEEVLFERLPAVERDGGFGFTRSLPLPLKSLIKRVARWITRRPAI